jgi:hypothetical protein
MSVAPHGAIKKPRTVVMIGAAVLSLVVASYVGYGWLRGVTKDEVEAEIRRELPVGSTQAQIFAFLDEEGAEYQRMVRRAEPFWALERRGVPPDTMVIAAILRDTGWQLLPGESFIQIYFILGPDGLLEGYYVEEGSSLI